MAASKKNNFWEKRTKHGRDKIFESPESLLNAANEYFKWVTDNPLYEKIIQSGKEFDVPKMRAMSISGLCIYLNIGVSTFYDYCDSENESYKDFSEVTTRIQEIIKTQKFEGASAGMLNSNIIAYDLGMKDKDKSDDKKTKIILEFGGAVDMSDYLEDDSKE